MTQPFLGEVQMFGFNFPPYGWAFCNGATLGVQQNQALFSLLGVTYGGDGRSTFQLPNFASRSLCEQGRGPNTTGRRAGDVFGTNAVTLTTAQMPAHSHGLTYFSQSEESLRSATPRAGNALSVPTAPDATPFAPSGSPFNSPFATNMIQPVGGDQPHPNQQPYLSVNFCIALRGTFPSFG